MNEKVLNSKRNVIFIGRMLWEKDLVSALNGNISERVEEDVIVVTATKTCLGLLEDKDVLTIKLSGEVLEKGQVTSEKALHTDIYKAFPDVHAVIHTHTPFINGFFLEQDILLPKLFETKFYLGTVRAIKQNSPNVTDIAPVIEELKKNNIVVLKNHGVLAVGKTLRDCFYLIQNLEDAIKVDAISRLYQSQGSLEGEKKVSPATKEVKTYLLFSSEQMEEIVRLVNSDEQMKSLGEKTHMTMDLAIKLEETGKIYSFKFVQGQIVSVGDDGNAEFFITASEKVWRAVFNQEIDPFVATTQKKMILKGDFAKISKWYAPCSRVFELWQKVPVQA
ncbi:MAG TPA: class II aldolase/adducin family protein [Candidatus Omnitrophota bacterium]|nr:class II aldolase/adducin family protein [Candidatus Omnitrophota bacterium]HPN88657.1 class II aldolase/adducin family protein [Candidatus Omnitrophota bacterium]